MATSKTPRVGLMRWTDNSDPYPTRAEWDAEQTVLEARILVWRGQGTLENRPAAGVPGGVYVVPSADSIVTYYDTGSKWIESSQLGGVTPSTVNVGGTGTEGSSVRAARADHTHTIPSATSSNAGAMSAADKAKLDASTTSAGANTLAQRNASGGTAFSSVSLSNAPSAAGDATRKDYVDSTANSAASSAVNAIPLATSTVDGLMRKIDKSKLDAATASAIASTLVTRDTTGKTTFDSVGVNKQPSVASDLTRKDYVDGLVSAVRDVVDAGTASSTPNTLVRRDANGSSAFAQVTINNDPTNTSHAARKSYVDAQTALRLGFALELGTGSIDDVREPGYYYQTSATPINTTNGYPINGAAGALLVYTFGQLSGGYRVQEWTQWGSTQSNQRKWIRTTNSSTTWTAWREFAGTEVATSSSDGLMLAADKALLDTNTIQATASALVKRDSNAQINVPSTPTSNNHAASKAYTDSTSQSAATSAANTAVAAIPLATASVDGLMPKADKSKLDKATSAATASTLVMLDSAGRARVKNPYATEDIANKAYTDSTAASAASSAVSAIPNATSSVDGLMPKADKAKLDAATQNSTNNTLVQRSSAGGIVVSGVKLGDTTPSGNDYATSKSYVDAQDAKQVTAATPLNTSDLNTITTDGNYVQTASANATSARNYPQGLAGLLVVSSYSSFVFQTYTTYNSSTGNRQYYRGKYGTAWSTWREIAFTDLATASADGLMSKADKALLDTATWNDVGSSLVRRLSGGQFSVASPSASSHAANKGYVDSSISEAVKDTGWRDLRNTGYVDETHVGSPFDFAIRRQNDRIYLRYRSGLNGKSSSTNPKRVTGNLASMLDGMGGTPHDMWIPTYAWTTGSVVEFLHLNVENSQAIYLDFFRTNTSTSSWSIVSQKYAEFSWSVNKSWPTGYNLPGTPL